MYDEYVFLVWNGGMVYIGATNISDYRKYGTSVNIDRGRTHRLSIFQDNTSTEMDGNSHNRQENDSQGDERDRDDKPSKEKQIFNEGNSNIHSIKVSSFRHMQYDYLLPAKSDVPSSDINKEKRIQVQSEDLIFVRYSVKLLFSRCIKNVRLLLFCESRGICLRYHIFPIWNVTRRRSRLGLGLIKSMI